jgi:hypothetical protein
MSHTTRRAANYSRAEPACDGARVVPRACARQEAEDDVGDAARLPPDVERHARHQPEEQRAVVQRRRDDRVQRTVPKLRPAGR